MEAIKRTRDGQQESLSNGRKNIRLSGLLRCCLMLLALMAAMCPQRRIDAQTDAPAEINQESAIKAAYLYNFGRYVVWPERTHADNRAPFVIGVLGTDRLGALLDEIAANKQIEGRPIVARRFATMSEYKPCQILFVAAGTPPAQVAAAIRIAKGGGVLLVGEEAGFAQQGGLVNFFIEQNKVRFEINAEAAVRDGLKISSKLLGLARIVGE